MAKGAAVEGGGGEGVEVMCDAASRSSVPRLPARAAGAERLTMHAGGERPWAMHGVVMLARTDAKARWSWVRRRHEILVAFAVLRNEAATFSARDKSTGQDFDMSSQAKKEREHCTGVTLHKLLIDLHPECHKI